MLNKTICWSGLIKNKKNLKLNYKEFALKSYKKLKKILNITSYSSLKV